MALLINRVTQVITVPKTDLAHVTGTLYEHDTNAFLRAVRVLESSVEGIVEPDILSHNTEYTVAGVTYARKVEVISGYSVEYENGSYSVRLVNSNNNMFDIQNGILVQNNVQVIPSNSAGLQVVVGGSGSGSGSSTSVTAQDKADIAISVENVLLDNFSSISSKLTNVESSFESLPTLLDIEGSAILAKKTDISIVEAIVNSIPQLSDIKEELINVQFGGLEIVDNQLIIKDKAGSIIAILDLFDKNGNPTMLSVYKRTVVS